MTFKDLVTQIEGNYSVVSNGEDCLASNIKKKDVRIKINSSNLFDICAYMLYSKGRYSLIFDITGRMAKKLERDGLGVFEKATRRISNVEDFDALIQSTPHSMDDNIDCYIESNTDIFTIKEVLLKFQYSMDKKYHGFFIDIIG